MFSAKLLEHPEAQNEEVLKRIELAKNRIQSVLDRERVAIRKTLEQKISDQGPQHMRVDPHLLGLAIMDLLEQSRLKIFHHGSTTKQQWFANLLAKDEDVIERLNVLAPLYHQTTGHFSNLVGDALEIITEKSIALSQQNSPRHSYQGHFLLEQEKDKFGRYKKFQPPKFINSAYTQKEADFLIFGYDEGPICVECKNYREWIYPGNHVVNETIIKSYELDCIPLFIGRRIHYTTQSNLFSPAGILFHESYYQYYPSDHGELADDVKNRTNLGFSDVKATETPHKRTKEFFSNFLPNLLPQAAERWNKHRDSLYAYAKGQMFLAQLYTEIESPAGGKWENPDVPF